MKRVISVILILCCLFLCGCGAPAGDPVNTVPDIPAEEPVDFFEAVKSAPQIYTNKEHGVSFILPAGWKVAAMDDADDKLLITADSDGFPVMMYACQDMWIQMEEDAKNSLSRSILNNDLLSLDIAIDKFGSLAEERELVELNGCEFFRGKTGDFVDAVDESIVWYRMENGWVDIFAFGADEDNPYYAQFEELISSAVFDREFEEDEAVDVEPTEKKLRSDEYLPAKWSDELFKRNGCSGYPLILDTPIKKCTGFTVDYTVTDVTGGKMKTDAKFQIFYQTLDGTWVKGKTFTLDDGFASVEQIMEKPVTVTQVIVLCLNSGNFSWTERMKIRNPLY